MFCFLSFFLFFFLKCFVFIALADVWPDDRVFCLSSFSSLTSALLLRYRRRHVSKLVFDGDKRPPSSYLSLVHSLRNDLQDFYGVGRRFGVQVMITVVFCIQPLCDKVFCLVSEKVVFAREPVSIVTTKLCTDKSSAAAD